MNTRVLFSLLLSISLACMTALADSTGAPNANAISQDYANAMTLIFSPAGIQDFIARADAIGDVQDRAGLVQTETKAGLHMTFTLQRSPEAVLYYYSLSRSGAELHYSEAVKLIALFTDRVGLTHPLDVTTGERDIYYVQWLFKPSDAKKLQKLMLQARTRNRAEKDPVKAFSIAVQRELDARAAVHSDIDRDPRR